MLLTFLLKFNLNDTSSTHNKYDQLYNKYRWLPLDAWTQIRMVKEGYRHAGIDVNTEEFKLDTDNIDEDVDLISSGISP